MLYIIQKHINNCVWNEENEKHSSFMEKPNGYRIGITTEISAMIYADERWLISEFVSIVDLTFIGFDKH